MHWPQKEWLTLSEVARILGVHPSTVRIWANQGKIPVHRTSGGHRRFRRSELELWLMARQQEHDINIPHDFIQATLRQVRMQADEGILAQQPWYQKLTPEVREQYRRSGQQMLQSLWSSLMNKNQDAADEANSRAESRALGYAYAARARQAGLTATEALAALLFFANTLVDAILEVIEDSSAPSPHAWILILRKTKAFVTHTATTMIEIYETYEQKLPSA